MPVISLSLWFPCTFIVVKPRSSLSPFPCLQVWHLMQCGVFSFHLYKDDDAEECQEGSLLFFFSPSWGVGASVPRACRLRRRSAFFTIVSVGRRFWNREANERKASVQCRKPAPSAFIFRRRWLFQTCISRSNTCPCRTSCVPCACFFFSRVIFTVTFILWTHYKRAKGVSFLHAFFWCPPF